MRGLDVLLGGLLVTSGLMAPIAGPGGSFESLGPLNATARLETATYDGNATVRASDGLLEVKGPYEASAWSRQVTVKRYEFRTYGETTASAGGWEAEAYLEERPVHQQRARYGNASLSIEGTDSGSFMIWPNVSMPPLRMALGLEEGEPGEVFASAESVRAETEDQHFRRDVRSPLIALGHNLDQRQAAMLGGSPFEHLRATGGMDMIIFNATFTVDSRDGTETYWTGVHEADEGLGEHVEGKEYVYAVVSTASGKASMGFQDVRSTFVAKEANLNLNGTVNFDAIKGNASTRSSERNITGDRVDLVGNLTLGLEPVGSPEPLHRRVPAVASDPVLEADIEGDAQEMRVDGRPVEVPEPPTTSETVSLIGKIVGLVLLGWAALKKMLAFATALFIRDPLENPRREQIIEFLDRTGLAYLREISKATGMPVGSAAYHLRILRRFGFVASIKRAGLTVYFPTSPDLSAEEMRSLAFLAQPTRRKIAETVVEEEPITQQDLADRLDLAVSTVSRQLSKLVENGLLNRKGKRGGTYHASPLLRDWASNARG